ncbi:MAG: hypothetical protein ACI9XC_001347, partial [Gammaproteobacteria bacterium]
CNCLFLIDFFIYFVGIPQVQVPKGTSAGMTVKLFI